MQRNSFLKYIRNMELKKYLPKYIHMAAYVFIVYLACGCHENKTQKQNEISTPNVAKQSITGSFTGFIKGIGRENSGNYLLIDTVEWFTGKEARLEYDKDKKLFPGSKPEEPQGFYVRNLKIDSLKLGFPDDAEVIMQTLSYNKSGNFNFNQKINGIKFLALLKQNNSTQFLEKPYIFKAENNKITSVKEIYIP